VREALRTGALAALAAALLPLTGCAGGASPAEEVPVADVSIHDDDGLTNGAVLSTPYTVPRVPLVDTAGHRYDLATDARRPLTLVFFGYTNCPDVCQVVLATIASALTRLDDAERAKVGMVFVTTDPARDTPGVLRSYLDRFDPGFQGLSGGLARIKRVGTALGVAIEKGQPLASGGYDVAHGTAVVGMLPGGHAPYVWTQGTSASGLADDLTDVLHGSVRRRDGAGG
jgi:protein SCO1/2